MCTFGLSGCRVKPRRHHQNSTKGPQEREERMKTVAGEGKKKHEIFGPPLFGAPTLRAPPFVVQKNSTSQTWPKSKLVELEKKKKKLAEVEIGRSRPRSLPPPLPLIFVSASPPPPLRLTFFGPPLIFSAAPLRLTFLPSGVVLDIGEGQLSLTFLGRWKGFKTQTDQSRGGASKGASKGSFEVASKGRASEGLQREGLQRGAPKVWASKGGLGRDVLSEAPRSFFFSLTVSLLVEFWWFL